LHCPGTKRFLCSINLGTELRVGFLRKNLPLSCVCEEKKTRRVEMRVHKKSGLKNGQGTRPSGNQLSALETGLGGRKKPRLGRIP